MLARLISVFFFFELFLASFVRAFKVSIRCSEQFLFIICTWSYCLGLFLLFFLIIFLIIIRNLLDHWFIFTFIQSFLCIRYSAGLVEPFLSLCLWISSNIAVHSFCACLDFGKLIPVINYLIAACPAFFRIVEQWFARMKLAGSSIVFGIKIFLIAAMSSAFFELFCHVVKVISLLAL